MRNEWKTIKVLTPESTDATAYHEPEKPEPPTTASGVSAVPTEYWGQILDGEIAGKVTVSKSQRYSKAKKRSRRLK